MRPLPCHAAKLQNVAVSPVRAHDDRGIFTTIKVKKKVVRLTGTNDVHHRATRIRRRQRASGDAIADRLYRSALPLMNPPCGICLGP